MYMYMYSPDPGGKTEIPTDMPQSAYPEGFYRALMDCAKLDIPIYVTENGIADKHDDRRELFIKRYLYAMSRAIQDGADVRGYYYWSMMVSFTTTTTILFYFNLNNIIYI